ncbi:hypothetical protein Hesp01_71170 [Herbidospora sp. NBRC 101105]|nr:hypothetical protein Hesp01_71170 [Herbidospora sp. NBRC 101105]
MVCITETTIPAEASAVMIAPPRRAGGVTWCLSVQVGLHPIHVTFARFGPGASVLADRLSFRRERLVNILTNATKSNQVVKST